MDRQYNLPLGSYFLYSDEVSFSLCRENLSRLLWVNFFQFYICSNSVFKSPPISLCLSTSYPVNYLFFYSPTQTLCEEILC
jgi:hypothetical protein